MMDAKLLCKNKLIRVLTLNSSRTNYEDFLQIIINLFCLHHITKVKIQKDTLQILWQLVLRRI